MCFSLAVIWNTYFSFHGQLTLIASSQSPIFFCPSFVLKAHLPEDILIFEPVLFPSFI